MICNTVLQLLYSRILICPRLLDYSCISCSAVFVNKGIRSQRFQKRSIGIPLMRFQQKQKLKIIQDISHRTRVTLDHTFTSGCCSRFWRQSFNCSNRTPEKAKVTDRNLPPLTNARIDLTALSMYPSRTRSVSRRTIDTLLK